MPGSLVQFVVSPIADPGAVGSIPARPHSFVEIDREIYSAVTLVFLLIQELLLSVTSEGMCTKYWLTA